MAANDFRGCRPPVRIAGDALTAFWILTVGIAILDGVGAVALGWPVPWRFLAIMVSADLALVAPLFLRRYLESLRLRTMIAAVAALLNFLAFAIFLSYLVVATAAPLADARFADADRALGFDYASAVVYLQGHRWIGRLLDVAYISGLLQLWSIVLVLGILGWRARVGEFLLLFAVANLLAIAISGCVPAAGPWVFYGVGTSMQLGSISDFEALRTGVLQAYPLSRAQGLVSMPSMHAASAVLFTYAVRGTPWIVPVVALNVLMIVSTPLSGGHYLVDVIAGVALASIVILAGRAMSPARRQRDSHNLLLRLAQESAR